MKDIILKDSASNRYVLKWLVIYYLNMNEKLRYNIFYVVDTMFIDFFYICNENEKNKGARYSFITDIDKIDVDSYIKIIERNYMIDKFLE